MNIFLWSLLLISVTTLFSMENSEFIKTLNAKKYSVQKKFRDENMKGKFLPSPNNSTRGCPGAPRKKKHPDQSRSIQYALGKKTTAQRKLVFTQNNYPKSKL